MLYRLLNLYIFILPDVQARLKSEPHWTSFVPVEAVVRLKIICWLLEHISLALLTDVRYRVGSVDLLDLLNYIIFLQIASNDHLRLHQFGFCSFVVFSIAHMVIDMLLFRSLHYQQIKRDQVTW